MVGIRSLKFEGNGQRSKLCSLISLRTLRCSHRDMDEVPGLDSLVGVKFLSLEWSARISKLPSLTGLQCLCNLSISWLGISEIPNLSRLEQLQVIKASHNRQLTSLQSLANLPALKLTTQFVEVHRYVG